MAYGICNIVLKSFSNQCNKKPILEHVSHFEIPFLYSNASKSCATTVVGETKADYYVGVRTLPITMYKATHVGTM